MMRVAVWVGLLAVLFGGGTARAQNSPNITDPFAVLTYADSAGQCVPQQADNGASYVAGCCAAPGRTGCVGNGTNGYPLPACLTLDSTLAFDLYDAGVLCTMPAVAVDPVIPTLGLTGTDMTFYVTSDIHFFRRTYNLTDQLTHVKVLNHFASTGAAWPTAAGIPAGTAIAAPLALIIDGDITTHGLAQDLGAFRLNYERGTVPASIQYPVLFGIGNHETVSDETPENAKRSFDYLVARMGNTNMDTVSGNYSWDWQGVHFVQMNTWAGDQTSVYAHVSDGLAWLTNDLATHVGKTTRPVVLLEHYLLANVYPTRVSDATNDDFFPTDENAIDSTGAKTGQGYETFWKIIENYNVIGMFGGHDHCLGMYNTTLTNLPITGALYPAVSGYALPMDNFDDGSGGDTGDGTDNQAGLGNGCAATTINGQSVAQTAVASFLVTHINAQYMDVAAVSWTGDGSTPYFDAAGGYPTGATACRKRINSQFIPAASLVQVTQTASGYSVVAGANTPANVPMAIRFNSRSGVRGFNFVDMCADPTDTGQNNLYFLVNGENPLTAGTTYSVAATRTGTASVSPVAVLLTPLSGVTPSVIAHTAVSAPAADTVTVYGPPNTSVIAAVSYAGTAAGWLSVAPASFNAYGIATLTLTYTQPAGGFGTSSAVVTLTSSATGVVQSVSVTVTQSSLQLALSAATIYEGGQVTFTATAAAAASGSTVSFLVGGVSVGSAQVNGSGVASFPYTANTLGGLSITATSGTASSAVQTLTVGPPVSMAASTAAVTVLPGHSGSLSLALSSFGGYAGAASIGCSSPVSYVTCAVSPMSVSFANSGTASVSATVNVAASVAGVVKSEVWLASFGVTGLLLLLHRRKRVGACVLLCAGLFVAGCGSGAATQSGGSASNNAPSGSQVVTFTVTANGVAQSVPVVVSFQ